MKQPRILVIGFLILILVAFCCLTRAESYSQYLTVADVEKLTNLRGVTMKEDPKVLHFFRKDGKEIVRVTFEEKPVFKTYTSQKTKYRPLLPPIAMESISGVPQMPYMIVFLTKKQTVIVQTFHLIQLQTIIPFWQLQAIARQLGAKLQPT